MNLLYVIFISNFESFSLYSENNFRQLLIEKIQILNSLFLKLKDIELKTTFENFQTGLNFYQCYKFINLEKSSKIKKYR